MIKVTNRSGFLSALVRKVELKGAIGHSIQKQIRIRIILERNRSLSTVAYAIMETLELAGDGIGDT